MNTSTPKEPVPIRLVFTLARAEHPRLYDELIRFHKGVKRVNRLRVLAYDGLLVQQELFAPAAAVARMADQPGPAQEGSAAVTNALFGPAIEE